MMRFNATLSICIILTLPVAVASPASADVEVFGNDDRDGWFDAVGAANVSTVDFTGYPENTPVVDQWSHLGVTFPGFDVTAGESFFLFPQDGWGLRGFSEINVVFDQPMSWIAFDFPGVVSIDLFDGDTLIHHTDIPFGGGGTGFFGGLISDQTFDRAHIIDPDDAFVSLDNLHFGPPIPAPASLAPLAMLLCARSRRRRRLTCG